MPAAAHKGAIAFGLVYIPVSLYTAVSEGGVSFNQLHKDSMARIRYKKVRADTGEEVPPEQIVRGYQYERDRYVVLTDEEIEAVKTPKDKTITILHFAPNGSIDPIYYDKTYYAAPDGADKAYALLREAMERQNVVAVAKTVLGTRESLLCLSPGHEGIIVETLHYMSEIKSVPKAFVQPELTEAERSMAAALIQAMTGPFQPEQYRDEYEVRLRAAIEGKINGQEVAAAQPQQAGNVIDLMEALQRSLAQKAPEKAGVV